jgi:hypothetical protein
MPAKELMKIKNDFPMESGNYGEYVDKIPKALKSLKS